MNAAFASGPARHEPFLTSLSGLLFGLVLPLAMVAANRSAVLLAGLAALCAIGGVMQAGRLGEIRSFFLGNWSNGAVLALIIFGYVSASALWAHHFTASLFSLGEFTLAALPGVVLLAAWRIEAPARLGLFLAVGLMAAALATIADLRTDLAFRVRLGLRPQNYVLNRSVMTQLVLLWPMALCLKGRARWLGGLAAVCVAGAVFMAESTSAVLGLAAGALALVFASVAPRLSIISVFSVACMLLLAAPRVGDLIHSVLPPAFHEKMAQSHSDDRVRIWQSYGAAVAVRPLVGAGFNASARLAEDPAVEDVPAPLRTLLGAGHPHNAYLQIWVDLGAFGVVLTLISLILAALSLMRMQGARRTLATGLAASILAIAGVSHGAWQGWWIAVVGASIAVFIAKETANDRV